MKSGMTYTQLLFRICVECSVSTLNTDLSKDELTKLGKQVKNTIFHKCNDIFINEIKRQEGKVRFYKSTAFVWKLPNTRRAF